MGNLGISDSGDEHKRQGCEFRSILVVRGKSNENSLRWVRPGLIGMPNYVAKGNACNSGTRLWGGDLVREAVVVVATFYAGRVSC